MTPHWQTTVADLTRPAAGTSSSGGHSGGYITDFRQGRQYSCSLLHRSYANLSLPAARAREGQQGISSRWQLLVVNQRHRPPLPSPSRRLRHQNQPHSTQRVSPAPPTDEQSPQRAESGGSRLPKCQCWTRRGAAARTSSGSTCRAPLASPQGSERLCR